MAGSNGPKARCSSGLKPSAFSGFILRTLQLRSRSPSSLFSRRDRTREVDFVADTGGRLELFEAKWTELPDGGDTVNLDFVRSVVGKSRVAAGAVVCRTSNGFPLANGFRALPIAELR
jgi:hypothetical protein